VIAEYVAMMRKTIPSMTVSYDENRNQHSKELNKLKQYLLSLTLKLYTFSQSLEYNDFVLLHGVTAAWSLCQILPYLKVNDVNKVVQNFMCVLIAVFVIQKAHSMDKGMEEAARWRSVESRRMMAELALKLKGEALSGTFRDEHVYKLLAVALDCLEDGSIDDTTALLAVRKVINYPLTVTGRGNRINEDQDNHS